MFVTEVFSGHKLPVTIENVSEGDFKEINSRRYWFNWKKTKKEIVYKLCIQGKSDILGLIWIEPVAAETRIEIKLLCASRENVGPDKIIDGIVGNLLAFAARLAVTDYGPGAAISLIPKTTLAQYYMDRYGFEQAGRSLFMTGRRLSDLLRKYEL